MLLPGSAFRLRVLVHGAAFASSLETPEGCQVLPLWNINPLLEALEEFRTSPSATSLVSTGEEFLNINSVCSLPLFQGVLSMFSKTVINTFTLKLQGHFQLRGEDPGPTMAGLLLHCPPVSPCNSPARLQEVIFHYSITKNGQNRHLRVLGLRHSNCYIELEVQRDIVRMTYIGKRHIFLWEVESGG